MADRVSFRQVGKEYTGRLFKGPNQDAYARISQPSIPYKEDVVLSKQHSLQDGFGRRVPRFLNRPDNAPGPGHYPSVPNSHSSSPSFSKKGFLSAFVSNTKRFKPRQFASIVPGPGSYVISHKRIKSNPSAIFATEQIRFRRVKESVPAPGQYNLAPEMKPRVSGPSNIFKSTTKRSENTFPIEAPAPWHYNPDDKMIRSSSQELTSAFKPPVNGRRFKINLYDPHAPVNDGDVGPGPGFYTLENSFEKDHGSQLSVSYSHQELDRFGQSVRTKRIKAVPPGPGTYKSIEEEEKQAVSGSVFMSESQRILRKTAKIPGPAFYKPSLVPKKKSFHLNATNKWV